MPQLEALVDGERLGLIGAARRMEAGARRSRLEGRFAVRCVPLAHDLCGYVRADAAVGPASIAAAQPAEWLPFVLKQKQDGGWKPLWLHRTGQCALSTFRREQVLEHSSPSLRGSGTRSFFSFWRRK